MNAKNLLLEVFVSLLVIIKAAESIVCFKCTTDDNPSCGIYFKAYQFRAEECGPGHDKCALQREPPRSNGWVPIVRDCYQTGSIIGMNESNGCRDASIGTETGRFKAKLCFCDTDYCNTGPCIARTNVVLMCLTVILVCVYFR